MSNDRYAYSSQSLCKIRPFCCDLCRSTFTLKHNLKKHIISTKHYLGTKIPSILKAALPNIVKYSLCGFRIHGTNNFTVRICILDFNNLDELHRWITHLGNINNCVYVRKVSATKKNKTAYSFHTEVYYCQHFRPMEKKVYEHKGTKCQSKIFVQMKCEETCYISTIKITNNHNHSTTPADVLRFRRPSSEVRSIFYSLFQNGFSPVQALQCYETHLAVQMNDDDYLVNTALTNRSLMPHVDWIKHYFRKLSKTEDSGRRKGKISTVAVTAMKNFAQEKNAHYKQPVCVLKELGEEDEWVSSIVTPIMKRICRLRSSAEMISVDSTGSVNLFGLKVFLITADTCAGSLPVGIVISTSERNDVVLQGFRLFLSQIDDSCFGGNGKAGPLSIATHSSRIAVLRKVFPRSYFFTSTFHFLQDIYRWIMKCSNGISMNDKYSIYSELRNILYAQSEATLQRRFDSVMQTYGNKYSQFRVFALKLFKKRHEWAVHSRTSSLPRSLNRNAMVEQTIRTLKEEIFNRLKVGSSQPVELLDFTITQYEDLLKNKLVRFSLNHGSKCYSESTRPLSEIVSNRFEIRKIQECESLYNVFDKEKPVTYLLNTDIGSCTCFVGSTDSFCKHLQLLAAATNFDRSLRYPESLYERAELYSVATGKNVNVIFSPPSTPPSPLLPRR